MRLMRIGATSTARFSTSAGMAAVNAAMIDRPTPRLRPPVPLMNSSEPPGRTLPIESWATWMASQKWSSSERRAAAKSSSGRGP